MEKLDVKFVTNYKVDAAKFQAICNESDAVLISVGGHKARFFNWEDAENVIVVDVVKPAAFPKEIKRLENFGGKIIWPFVTKKITDDGIFADDGRFIAADQVIVSIGEQPILDFFPDDSSIKKFRGTWQYFSYERKFTGFTRLVKIYGKD